MCNKYFNGEILNNSTNEEIDNELRNYTLGSVNVIRDKINSLHMSEALEDIMNIARRCNKYIDETTPWALAKDENNKDRLGTVIYNLLEVIRFIGVLLQPFMPETSEKIFKQLNTNVTSLDSLTSFDGLKIGDKVSNAEPLFMRIDKTKNEADVK
jgi:methionyl-tRNA synthetase